MALDTKIQLATQEYRDTVLAMDENDVRSLAEDLGIDGFETTPLITLREELVQHKRNEYRAYSYPSPVAQTHPGTGGNPGNDNAAIEP